MRRAKKAWVVEVEAKRPVLEQQLSELTGSAASLRCDGRSDRVVVTFEPEPAGSDVLQAVRLLSRLWSDLLAPAGVALAIGGDAEWDREAMALLCRDTQPPA